MANSWGVSWGVSWGDSWGAAAADDGVASGTTLTVTALIISGVASGIIKIEDSGGGPREFPQPPLIRIGEASGKTLILKARLIPGRARSLSLIGAGRAVGGGTAHGQTIELRASVHVGVASGSANVQAETKSLRAWILPGAATGVDDDEASVVAWLLAA